MRRTLEEHLRGRGSWSRRAAWLRFLVDTVWMAGALRASRWRRRRRSEREGEAGTMGKGTSVHALVRDLAFAGRALRRRPGFAAVVILTSGLNRAAPAAVVLLLVASVGCWVPARRATRVDPAMALRG